MEIKTNVKTYRVDYRCDQCKQENMVDTGKSIYVGGVMYEHQCPMCGFRKNLNCKYPKLVYEKDENS